MSESSAPAPTHPAEIPAPRRRRTAHNVFWLVAERGLKAIGGVGLAVLIARHLGPEHYGSYGAAIGLATLAKEAVMLGFDRMVRRDLAARPADAGAIMGTSVVLGLLVSLLVVSALTGLAGQFVDDAETRRLTLIVIWMALPQAFFSCEIWFESSGDTRPLVWTRNVVWITALTGRLLLIWTGAEVTAFAVIALVEWVVTYAAVTLLLRGRTRGAMRFAFHATQLKAWIREGWPAVLMVLVGSTADRIMVLLVHTLAVDPEAGYLNAALRITEVWWSISTIIGAVLLPRIVSMQRVEPARCAEITQLYANCSLLVGTGAAVAVTLTAPFLIPWLFGAAYAPSAVVLVILFWSGPAIFPAVGRSQLWVSEKRLILDLPTVVGIAVVQLALSAMLVPRYGAVGAATAMTSAQWFGVYGLALLVPSLRRASRSQFSAFKTLILPWPTIRALFAFVKGMLHS